MRDLIQRDQEIVSQHRAIINALIEGEQSGITSYKVADILTATHKESGSA